MEGKAFHAEGLASAKALGPGRMELLEALEGT
jgi:hypothetical protein